jgi:hypothetical protein
MLGYEKAAFADQDMSGLQPAFLLEKEMGEGVGRGEILQ